MRPAPRNASIGSVRVANHAGADAYWLDPAHDRIMICGSPSLNKDMRELLDARGFVEGSTTTPGDYVVERAFVEQ